MVPQTIANQWQVILPLTNMPGMIGCQDRFSVKSRFLKTSGKDEKYGGKWQWISQVIL
jgi:hypothetical protein